MSSWQQTMRGTAISDKKDLGEALARAGKCEAPERVIFDALREDEIRLCTTRYFEKDMARCYQI